MNIILGLINTLDPTKSLRHAAYGLVIVMACVWLTYGLKHEGMTGNWLMAFSALLTAVGLVKAVGKPVGPAGSSAPGAVVVPTPDSADGGTHA